MKKFPLYLLLVYIIVFIWGAVNPYARDVWFVENATVWVVLISIIVLYACKVRFSNLAYFLMTIFIIMHTIGGTTHSNVYHLTLSPTLSVPEEITTIA